MEILATNTVYVEGALGTLLGVLFAIVAIVCTVAMLALMSEGEGLPSLIAFVGVLVSGLIIYYVHDLGSTTYQTHVVKIDDIEEVHELGYEIIDQDGKLFTIKKKDGAE